jgi:hypothetical protein
MNAYKMVPAILTLAGLVACGKSSSDGSSTAATTGTTRTPTGTVQAASVDELGLTGALNINLPPALSSSGSTLRLSGGQKSMEACLMRESAKQLVTQIKMISSTLCHIEAEGKNIPWNTPVILDIGDMAAGAEGPGDPTSGVLLALVTPPQVAQAALVTPPQVAQAAQALRCKTLPFPKLVSIRTIQTATTSPSISVKVRPRPR